MRRQGIRPRVSRVAASLDLVLAQLPEFAEKTIVIILPDAGERYLSTDLFAM